MKCPYDDCGLDKPEISGYEGDNMKNQDRHNHELLHGGNFDATEYEPAHSSTDDIAKLAKSHKALLASLKELIQSPNAKSNAIWDRARLAVAQAETL